MHTGTAAPVAGATVTVTVSSEVARLERLAGAPNASLTATADQSSPSAPPWPPRSSSGASEEQHGPQRRASETSTSSQAMPWAHSPFQEASRRTDEPASTTGSPRKPDVRNPPTYRGGAEKAADAAPPEALFSGQQMTSGRAGIAAELAELQDPGLPTAAELADAASVSQSEAGFSQRCEPLEMLNTLPLYPPPNPPPLSPPPNPTRRDRTPDGHPQPGTPLSRSLGLGAGQRVTSDGGPGGSAPPRAAPIMPSIRAPVSAAPVPGLGDGAAPSWVPPGAPQQKGPPFLQQLAAQAVLPGPRRTKQQRLEATFARAKARLLAMQEVRAFPPSLSNQ